MDNEEHRDGLQLLLFGLELRAHRDLIVALCREAGLSLNGKDALAFLQESVESRLDAILARFADERPDDAAALKRLYEEGKKRNG